MSVTLLASLGGLIIIGLGSYAGYLLLQVKKQKELQQQHQAIAIAKRNANIFENVDALCAAGIQGQCDLSEISIRVCGILDYVQGDEKVDVAADYPALNELHVIVKDMERGDARQALAKQDRMKQNLLRTKAEARLSDTIVAELTTLQKRIKPLNNQIAVTQIVH
ncbi:DUF2489 domain-containing protein [Vibrio tapetis]|uniref:DUF2489 domain-containing protein n=1 Tax=Vibrio tapetis subsp. tapetis TaxID=1671868 RepID=A0A2N8ZGS0_9VIBR|nr:DUF2489 domain-containing protein [Vibrio tapetis]SON51103.1 conserved exported protein of unknown function [Vibrio tapetis subsp. tapetis]